MKSHCPTNYALEHFGDRWTLLIVRDMFFKQYRYFADFLSCEEGISTSVLTERLRAMEKSGLIVAEKDSDGRRQRYVLTQKGWDLGRIMLEINRWSGKHDKNTEAPAAHLQRIESDFETLLNSYHDQSNAD